jgi:hypothetical protein
MSSKVDRNRLFEITTIKNMIIMLQNVLTVWNIKSIVLNT